MFWQHPCRFHVQWIQMWSLRQISTAFFEGRVGDQWNCSLTERFLIRWPQKHRQLYSSHYGSFSFQVSKMKWAESNFMPRLPLLPAIPIFNFNNKHSIDQDFSVTKPHHELNYPNANGSTVMKRYSTLTFRVNISEKLIFRALELFSRPVRWPSNSSVLKSIKGITFIVKVPFRDKSFRNGVL